MQIPRTVPVVAVLTAIAVLSGCSSAPDAPPADDEPGGHGYVEGAAEMPEPQLGIVMVDDAGEVSLLDLVTQDRSSIGQVDEPERVVDNGRFVFIQTAGAVTIVDSGRWTVPHGDHFHYYSAASRVVGSVEGELAGAVSSASKVALNFVDGTAVILDIEALGAGEVDELSSLDGLGERGVAAPLGDSLVATAQDDGEQVVAVLDATGAASDAPTVPCAPTGAATVTNVGVVIGCGAGAVLATEADGVVMLEEVLYPAEYADVPPAKQFGARIGRPTVAALAGDRGFWLLDTREREWSFTETAEPLADVTAIDDAHEMVVAVDAAGSIMTFDGTSGEMLAQSSAPELAESVTDASVQISTDASRAYVADPAGGRILEIDFADDARVARELDAPQVRFAAEVGL